MGLFRRNTDVEPEPEHCPLCGELVAEGADDCKMCGANLKPLRPTESQSG